VRAGAGREPRGDPGQGIGVMDGEVVFRRIGLVGHVGYAGLEEALGTVRRFADRHGIELSAEEPLRALLPGVAEFEPGRVDLLLTLGGDGTLLRGARLVAPYHDAGPGRQLRVSRVPDVDPSAGAGCFAGAAAGRGLRGWTVV